MFKFKKHLLFSFYSTFLNLRLTGTIYSSMVALSTENYCFHLHQIMSSHHHLHPLLEVAFLSHFLGWILHHTFSFYFSCVICNNKVWGCHLVRREGDQKVMRNFINYPFFPERRYPLQFLPITDFFALLITIK